MGPRRISGIRGRRRVIAWRGVVGGTISLALASCGGTHKATPPPPQRPVAVSRAPQLVSMRRIDGATWQTVVIRTDGTADVGIFIGERAGTHHRQFRLGSRALERIRQLIATAVRIRETPGFGSPTPSTEYIIFAQRRVFEIAKGHVPRQLAGLTGMLSGLIDQYA